MKILNQQLPLLVSTLLFLLVLFTAPVYTYAITLSAVVSDQSSEVRGGDRLYFEVSIKYPENPSRKDLRVEYQILEDGVVIASEKVLRAVETQASFLDYIVVPKSAKGGIHELNAVVSEYDGTLNQAVSATFNILRGVDQITMYFYIILASILLVAVLVTIQIFTARRRSA